jgi:hypothetical protein
MEKIKYIVLGKENGIATVKHKCWFCKRKHTVCYPFDDVGMDTKINQLCNRCESDLEKFKKSNPELC